MGQPLYPSATGTWIIGPDLFLLISNLGFGSIVSSLHHFSLRQTNPDLTPSLPTHPTLPSSWVFDFFLNILAHLLEAHTAVVKWVTDYLTGRQQDVRSCLHLKLLLHLLRIHLVDNCRVMQEELLKARAH